MINTMKLVDSLRSPDIKKEAIRSGFGRGLVKAGEQDGKVWAAVADLTSSTKMDGFAKQFPDRFVQVGIAEQNLVTVGAGIAAMGKTPFVSSYAAFSPGRNWEQIRTTIALPERNVKLIGSHVGVSVGPDGATHQMLEDIALMRVMPNMMVVAPADALEAEKATLAIAEHDGPVYMRLAREATPLFTTVETPFSLDKAMVLREGGDVSLITTGTMTYHALVAALLLEDKGIQAEVIHVPVVKPLDQVTVLSSLKKTKLVVTTEEAQIVGGLGGAIAELLADEQPLPMKRIGVRDRYGESGDPEVLMEKFGLTAEAIVKATEELINQHRK